MTAPVKVHLGCPSYDRRYNEGVVMALFAAARSGLLEGFQLQSGSWLAKNYNACYAQALNRRKTNGITHFAMLHEDVLPQSNDWLQKLVAIAEANDADILSVVSPLKSEAGITSTALDIDGTLCRRLTLSEIYADYPPTFTDPALLINTGLMLVDITKPWADELFFSFRDGIDQEDGKFFEWGASEDWEFSRLARSKGARIFATREIPILHVGGGQWSNSSGWGTVKTDVPSVPAVLQVAQ